VCQVCDTDASVEVHHKAGRVGGLLLNEDHWLAVCRYCHNRLHRYVAWAYEKGYLESRHPRLEQVGIEVE
jgi:hypothetical protein